MVLRRPERLRALAYRRKPLFAAISGEGRLNRAALSAYDIGNATQYSSANQAARITNKFRRGLLSAGLRTMEVEMKKFQLAALLPALSFALALPTLAAGTGQDTQGSVRADQLAQSQAEQQRLPAGKESTASNTAQNPSGPDSSSTTSKKSAVKSQKAKKHPPTAVMDRATPEKSPSETGSPGKHPATSATSRATPEKSTTETGTPGKPPAKKHPPTAVMDSATPEKSPSEAGTPGKHPATSKSADSKGTK